MVRPFHSCSSSLFICLFIVFPNRHISFLSWMEVTCPCSWALLVRFVQRKLFRAASLFFLPICAAKTLSCRFLIFFFRFGVIFLWAFVFRDRFPDRPYRFPRSLRSVSCFSCRSVCIFGLDQVDRKLNVLHQSWRDSTLLRPQQGERANRQAKCALKKIKTLIL